MTEIFAQNANYSDISKLVADLYFECPNLSEDGPCGECKICEAVQALTDLQRERDAQQWQPIETAPRDGSCVDLWVLDDGNDDRIIDAYWREDVSAWWSLLGGLITETPTHWMHRPEHPRTALGIGEARVG